MKIVVYLINQLDCEKNNLIVYYFFLIVYLRYNKKIIKKNILCLETSIYIA